MEELPLELKELILFFCDDDLLAVSIPRVSKLYNKLLEDNGAIWKAKCNIPKKKRQIKLADQSWKQFYFTDELILFPVFGFTIGKSTDDEPQSAQNNNEVGRLVVQGHKFWFGTNGVLNMMYTTRRNPLPYDWTDQGLRWKLSWVQCKKLLKRAVGNYRAMAKPSSAKISAILKQAEDIYYQIEFVFNYKQGDEHNEEMLFSISIMRASEEDKFEEYKERYINKECTDDNLNASK